MILDRVEFLSAIAFLKPAIHDIENSGWFNYLHVKTSVHEKKCILTSGNGRVFKRVTLLKPKVLESMIQPLEERSVENENFLIPKPTLESYECLCNKHKAKLKDKIKQYPDLSIIEIIETNLESHGSEVKYQKPVVGDVPIIDDIFRPRGGGSSLIGMTPDVLLNGMKGFDKWDVVSMHISNPDQPIYIHGKDAIYEAVVFPVTIEE